MSLGHARGVALVVDDEPLLRIDIATMLEEDGFTVVEVATTAAALRVLEARDDITLLFTDVRLLTGHEGLELAHEVARRWPPIALVVCSAILPIFLPPLPIGAVYLNRPYMHHDALWSVQRAVTIAARH